MNRTQLAEHVLIATKDYGYWMYHYGRLYSRSLLLATADERAEAATQSENYLRKAEEIEKRIRTLLEAVKD